MEVMLVVTQRTGVPVKMTAFENQQISDRILKLNDF